MKKVFAIAAALCLLTACGAFRQTPEEIARIETQVQERLDSRRFKVDVTHMQPNRGGFRALSSPYSLTINGDRVFSYLPYFGVAYNVPYGGGNGLHFDSTIDEYAEVAGETDRRTIIFSTRSEEDILLYQLVVFPNGRCTLNVRSRNREPINFQGTLDPDTDPALEKGEE